MKHLGFAAIVILMGAAARFLPHPPNFTPIAALALVGGAYLDKRYGFVLPLFALFLSDLFLGFHGLMGYVYGSFLLVGLIGVWVGRTKSITRMASGTLAGSIIFFAVTNFGVWLSGQGVVYPLTWAGLMECYTLAIPFFRNSLAGDAFFATVLFGVFEYARRAHGVLDTIPSGKKV
jgi:hypothetical protein